MAVTYIPITNTTLGSSASSVTFSNIPQTYSDLALKISARADNSSTQTAIFLGFNGLTSGYSDTEVYSIAANAVTSTRDSGFSGILVGQVNAALSLTNTFNIMDIYIPNYTSSIKKPISVYNVVENNSTTIGEWRVAFLAGMSTLSSAITSIEITFNTSVNFVTGSSFILYGIKNS